MTQERQVLRASDLAPLLGVSRGRIYQLIARGDLPATRCGRSIHIPREAWDQWLANQRDLALAATRGDQGLGSKS